MARRVASYLEIKDASKAGGARERERLNSERRAAQQSFVEIYNASEVEREIESN